MSKMNERGAVAAEFALLLPVLLTILFGIIEFGFIMYGREVVTNASKCWPQPRHAYSNMGMDRFYKIRP